MGRPSAGNGTRKKLRPVAPSRVRKRPPVEGGKNRGADNHDLSQQRALDCRREKPFSVCLSEKKSKYKEVADFCSKGGGALGEKDRGDLPGKGVPSHCKRKIPFLGKESEKRRWLSGDSSFTGKKLRATSKRLARGKKKRLREGRLLNPSTAG